MNPLKQFHLTQGGYCHSYKPSAALILRLFTESGQIANLICFSMIYPINPAKMQGEKIMEPTPEQLKRQHV